MTNNEKIDLLNQKLDALLKRHDYLFQEINTLRQEIHSLSAAVNTDLPGEYNIPEKKIEPAETLSPTETVFNLQPKGYTSPLPANPSPKNPILTKKELERFIGENLLNKIGIAITVIGVGIGAKYSIEHDLINPLTRIILGYVFGMGLLLAGMKLRAGYKPFSAVLVSGAMAIFYFITYAAYSIYGLIPQSVAFILMVVFTVFTVLAALSYNKQVIAQIGLVGAYAVPLLLSEGSGKVAILFSYMAIINTGILILSFKKYWKPLYYSSFVITWLIYFLWYENKYQVTEHFTLAFTFITLFFFIFYMAFLAYKLVRKELFNKDDIFLLLANSFVFYGLGYLLIINQQNGEAFLGMFTICNAIIHFLVSLLTYREKNTDRTLFYLVTGLVLVFITIAIPVQLNGNWVTLIWAGEAALLFWIGRSRSVFFYEKLSYPLMLLAFFSLLQDWDMAYGGNYYGNSTRFTPIFNIHFLSSLLFIAAFGFINYTRSLKKKGTEVTTKSTFQKTILFLIPAILLFAIYFSIRQEISGYWNHLFEASRITLHKNDNATEFYNYDLLKFRTMWILNYSLIFFSGLAWVNIKYLKNQFLARINLLLIVISLGTFLIQGLYTLSQLRETYLHPLAPEYFETGYINIGMRYISIACTAIALFTTSICINRFFKNSSLTKWFDLVLHVTVLWIGSSELIHWMQMGHSTQTNKLGLSILWGSYALFLIALGIWKKKMHVRVGAIVLFAVTLLKLFFYDISHLETISKTIVFVSLGLLLLIISFLYNKYKHLIFDDAEN